MSDSLILVAGGSGTRMGGDIPKQFLLLGGKPVILHTLEKFNQAIPDLELIVVLPKNQMEAWAEICSKHGFSSAHQVVAGGDSRSHSVFNGLQSCKGDGVIAVHDAVRPLLSIDLIKRCFAEAAEFGSAIPCVRLKDSIREVQDEGNVHADRERYRLIQTPQCFRADWLRKAYAGWDGVSVSDDAGLVERSGMKIHLCEGEELNIKITDKTDLAFARALIGPEGDQD